MTRARLRRQQEPHPDAMDLACHADECLRFANIFPSGNDDVKGKEKGVKYHVA